MKRPNNHTDNFNFQIDDEDFNRQTPSKSITDENDSFSLDIEFVDTETETQEHHHKHKRFKRKKKLTGKQKFLRGLIITVVILLILLIALFIAFCVIRYKGEYSLHDYNNIEIDAPDNLDVTLSDDGKTVEYDGKTYVFNTNITNILFIGVDQDELGTASFGMAGQADAVYLMAYDTSDGNCTLISISRDTIVDVDIYSSNGKYMGTKAEQLCLSFAYGDGEDMSCDNVITSVSRLFYGIPINSYFAIDISAISALNDSIGGVTLTVIEDIPGMSTGETVTLRGADAVTYVRYRDSEILESNSMRLERQKQYLSAFASKVIPSVRADISVALDLYNTVLDYSVTNIDASRVTYLATIFANGNTTELNIESVEGEIIKGEYYAEFYPDEKALYELILDIFYTVEK